MHRCSQSGAEGASSRHGCVEGMGGETIRPAAVAGGMFGGSMKYVVDLHTASLTSIRAHSIIVIAEWMSSPTPLASFLPIHHHHCSSTMRSSSRSRTHHSNARC